MARGPADNDRKSNGSETPVDGREAQVSVILKRIYDETVEEPVPDIFNDLLRKLG